MTTHDTIPVLENALFALSLCRSRLSDHVLEGRAIFEQLLSFEVGGNFPVYLHHFPRCFDPYLGLRIYPVLFWLMVDFSHVLGELKHRIHCVMERIVAAVEGQRELPPWAIQRLHALSGHPVAVGSYCEEAFPTLQMAEKQGASIASSIAQLAHLWHQGLQLYIGPAAHRHQWKAEPACTLFDLYVCSWQKAFSNRVLAPHPIHLKAALIRPFSCDLPRVEHPIPFVYFNPQDAIPLWIAWDCHTLALSHKDIEVAGSPSKLIITPQKDEEMAINFYLDYHPDHVLMVDGAKASIFLQEQMLTITSLETTVSLSFSSGDGLYCGHIMRGNRPFQHACKGENLYRSYDWRISIRTVRLGRTPIHVMLHLDTGKESPEPHPSHASHCRHTESSL